MRWKKLTFCELSYPARIWFVFVWRSAAHFALNSLAPLLVSGSLEFFADSKQQKREVKLNLGGG